MPPMVHGASGMSMRQLVSDKEEAEARAIQLALRKAFDEIDEDGGGTLDQEELIEMFAANGIMAETKDVDDLIRAANGATAEDDVSDLEVTFEAFSSWMQSSSPLADKMRSALGGMLEEKLDIDSIGIEEREQWYKDERGWVYPADSARQTVFIMLEEPNSSRMAKLISVVMMMLIAFSTAMFVLESVKSIQQQNPQAFVIAETVCIGSFTLEYLLRICSCVKRPYQDRTFITYILTPMNLVDIVAILPFYLELLLQAGGSFGVIRVLRLARVFRVMKVGTMSQNLSLVGEGLSRSASALTVLVYLMILFIVISSAIMHMAEWDPVECTKEVPNEFDAVSPCTEGFHTIPSSVWFVMVTMTSVGYGDYSPSGDFGKFVASWIMVLGVLSIAIPITLIGNKFNEVWMEARVKDRQKQARETMRLKVRQEAKGAEVQFEDVGSSQLKTVDVVFELEPPNEVIHEHLGILWYRGTEISTGQDAIMLRTVLSGSHASFLPHFSELQHDAELKNERLQLTAINGKPVDEMSFEKVLETVNAGTRPLALQLRERYGADVQISVAQKDADRELTTQSTIWSMEALVSAAIEKIDSETPNLETLQQMLTVLPNLGQDSPVWAALSAVLATAEEEQHAAKENGTDMIDTGTLLRRAAAADQRNQKRRERNAAALGKMDGVADEL